MTNTSVATPHTSGQPLKSVELTWDQIATGNFPAHQTPSAESYFLTALSDTMRRALHQLPDKLHGRLSKAHELVLAGHVVPLASGEYDVISQCAKGEKTYRVNGICDCPDYAKAPEINDVHFCKHKLASALYQRASQRAKQALEADLNGKPADPQADTPLPEAPASVNTFVDVDGHKVQVTLRGTDVSVLLR